MGRRDWLGIGLKVLGVYFGVTGAADLLGSFLRVAAAILRGEGEDLDGGAAAAALLRPMAFLLAAFVLVYRTNTCLRWCGEPAPAEATQP